MYTLIPSHLEIARRGRNALSVRIDLKASRASPIPTPDSMACISIMSNAREATLI